MKNNIRTWEITYKHPSTGETVKAFVYASTEMEARKKAWENNVPTRGESFFWKVISIKEYAA